MFSVGDPKLTEEIDGALHVTLSAGTVLILLEVSALVTGFLCSSGRYCRVSFLGDNPWCLCYFLKGDPEFLEELRRDGKLCPDTYSTYLLFLL